MAELKLNGAKRVEVGKGASRRSRSDGKVPAILYGRGMDPVALEVDRREFISALRTDAGMNVLLEIEVDGEQTLALTRELQTDPVRGTVLHADFVKVDRTQAIEVEVPVHVVGEAPGVKEGGVLEHPLFTVDVKCLPGEVPESIDVDISSLQIGDALRVSDLPATDKFEILDDPTSVVVSIAQPISEAELQAMEAGAGIEQEPTDEEVAAAAAAGEGEPAAGETQGEGEAPQQEA